MAAICLCQMLLLRVLFGCSLVSAAFAAAMLCMLAAVAAVLPAAHSGYSIPMVCLF
jgi:hypothetical protein